MHSRRNFLALSGLAALTPALAACGGQLAEPNVSAAGFGEQATGTLRIWTRSATQAGIQVIVDAFHASQDRIAVELTPVLDGQYVTKLATAIRGNAVPDLVDIDDINAMLFIYRDAFTDVTPLVDALPFKDKLSPGHLRLATNDSRQYGVPFLADNSVLWYNTDLLESAGVDPASSLTDFNGILDAARKVKALGKDTYAWSLAANSSGIIGFVVQPMIWAANARNISGPVGHQKGNIAGNDTVRATLQLYRTMWTEKLMPPGNYADSGTSWGSDFRAGQVAMIPSNYSAIVLSADKATRAKTGVRLLPGPTGGTAFFDGGDNMCIPRGARNASAAWEFVKFALDLPQQQRLPAGGYSPVRSDAATQSFRSTYPLDVVTLDAIKQGFAPTTLAYNLLYNQPDSPFFTMFRTAVFDGDIDGAMATAQSDYDRILEQAQR